MTDEPIEGELIEEEEIEEGHPLDAAATAALIRRDEQMLPSAEQVKEHIARSEAMRTAVIQMTDAGRHWDVFQDGKGKGTCRLNRHGAESIAQLLGITVGPEGQPWREPKTGYDKDNKGRPYYRWMYLYRAEFKGRSFGYVGIGDSRHKFFGTNFGKGSRLLEEVDEAQIQRLAQANAIVNCVGRFIDITTIPVEDFKVLTGKEPPSKISFKDKKSAPPRKSLSPPDTGPGSRAVKSASPEADRRQECPRHTGEDPGPPPSTVVPPHAGLEWGELRELWAMVADRVAGEYGIDPYAEFLTLKSGEHVVRENLLKMGESKQRRKWLETTLTRLLEKYPPRE